MQTTGTWVRNGLALALCGAVSAPAAVVLRTGFEENETPSYQAGEQLHHAGGAPYTWNWSGDNIGVISTAPAAVYDGAQGLDATRSTYGGSQMWWTRPDNAFPPMSRGSVEVEFALKTVGWADSPDSFLEIATTDILADDIAANSSRASWVTLKGNQRLYALDGNTEVELASGLTITDWNLVRLDINLMSSSYDIYLNDVLLGADFAFYGNGITSVSSLQFKEYNNGASSGGVYLDNLSIQWLPIPEPGTLGLLSIAGVLLFGHRRRLSSRRLESSSLSG